MFSIYFLSITFLSLVIVIFIKNRLIPLEYSYSGLFLLVFLSFLLVINNITSLKEIGITSFTLKGFLTYIFVTLLVSLIIWLSSKFLNLTTNSLNFHTKWIENILFYIVISSPIQEFLFRSFLFFSLNKMGVLNLTTMAFFSSSFFSIAHSVFEDRLFLIGTVIVGTIWGALYFFTPNLFLVSLSHAVIGVVAFKYGFINKKTFKLKVIPNLILE